MLKEMLMEVIERWEEKAEGTETQVDDIAVAVIKAMIDLLI